jgi:hypothetical protein
VILLKPQDVVVLMKLSVSAKKAPSIAGLASAVGMSASEVHAALTRSGAAGLLDFETRRPRLHNILEFLEHGIRYVFVPRRGEISRGIPTGFSAPSLSGLFANPYRNVPLIRAAAAASGTPMVDPSDVPLIWPHAEGTVRGETLEPLYPSVVDAALRDPSFYECMALVDALRIGKARERKLAIDLLARKVRAHDP